MIDMDDLLKPDNLEIIEYMDTVRRLAEYLNLGNEIEIDGFIYCSSGNSKFTKKGIMKLNDVSKEFEVGEITIFELSSVVERNLQDVKNILEIQGII